MILKWGIAGCGGISGDFVRALSLLPSTEHQVVAVATANSVARAEEFLKKYKLKGSGEAYGSYADLFANNNIDMVYVGNLHPQHKDTVIGALEAGKDVLCEKPMGMNAAEVREMVECARKNKKFLMEAYWSRFFPAYNRIKTELSDYLGEAKLVTANFGQYFLEEDSPRFFKRELGGGGLLDTGCYPLQFALWVFGEKPEKIVATGHLNAKTGVDETGSITLLFSRNRMAQLSYSLKIKTDCAATIYGIDGKFIKLPETFWRAQKIETSETKLDFPITLPETTGGFNYNGSEGLIYEAHCVRECIQKGCLECPKMTLNDSIMIAEVMEECHNQLYSSISRK